MPKARPRIFFSYAHDQNERETLITEQLLQQVRGALPGEEVFVDRLHIELGEKWDSRINQAIEEARLTIFLVSAPFLASSYVQNEQLRAHVQRAAGRQAVLPILMSACLWEGTWLKDYQLKPTVPLAQLSEQELPTTLKQLAREVRQKFQEQLLGPSTRGECEAASQLLQRTILRTVGAETRAALASKVVAALDTVPERRALYSIARFCIEYELLTGEPLITGSGDFQDLAGSTARLCERVTETMRKAKPHDYADTQALSIKVDADFFTFVRQREGDWFRYFEALNAELTIPRIEIVSLCQICARGFSAPQYLIAGLLSRFNDDWKPVLDAYADAGVVDEYQPGGQSFRALQASQWSCWLLWGPSIPICECAEWQGETALQLGYGDENNSIPMLQRDGGSDLRERVEDACRAGNRAAWTAVKGQLRWAPWLLRRADQDDPRRAGAPAQLALYEGGGLRSADHSDGIVLEVDSTNLDYLEDGRTVKYFSSYLWLMFWVGCDEQGMFRGVGKREVHAPPRNGAGSSRPPVRLWEDLMPVFVHANIADRHALGLQQNVLVEAAISLIKESLRAPGMLDARAGLKFHLVGASDFPGCGAGKQGPAGGLLQRLREHLEEEPESVRKVVWLPSHDGSDVPVFFRDHLSTCALPKLVRAYYDRINQLS